jgi:endonuclease/exonuclease/phosphatase family metal-dependent hydrolase
VYSVALDWPPHAGATRLHSLRQLAALVQQDQQTRRVPVLVAGDFNSPPDSDEVRALTGRHDAGLTDFVLFDAWEAAGPPGAAGVTWSRSNPWAAPLLLPDRRIDYVFTTGPRRGGAGSPVEARLAGEAAVDGVVPSDHYGVVVDVRY